MTTFRIFWRSDSGGDNVQTSRSTANIIGRAIRFTTVVPVLKENKTGTSHVVATLEAQNALFEKYARDFFHEKLT